MNIIRRLYREASPQTIELLVIRFAARHGLIDSPATRYQDGFKPEEKVLRRWT